MYAAQTEGYFYPEGFDLHLADSDDIDMEELMDAMAKDIAVRQHGWEARDQLSDENVTLLAKTLASIQVPSLTSLQEAPPCVLAAILDVVNKVGFNCSLALNSLLRSDPKPKPKTPSFTDVDIPQELEKRNLQNVGRLPLPTQEMVNSS